MISQKELEEYNSAKHLLDIRYTDEEKKQMIKEGKMKTYKGNLDDPNWAQKMVDACPELFPEGFVVPESLRP
jgi:hypothetical protein